MQPSMFSSLPWLPRSSEVYMLCSTAENCHPPGFLNLLLLLLYSTLRLGSYLLPCFNGFSSYTSVHLTCLKTFLKWAGITCVCVHVMYIFIYMDITYHARTHTHIPNAESIPVYIFSKSLLPCFSFSSCALSNSLLGHTQMRVSSCFTISESQERNFSHENMS